MLKDLQPCNNNCIIYIPHALVSSDELVLERFRQLQLWCRRWPGDWEWEMLSMRFSMYQLSGLQDQIPQRLRDYLEVGPLFLEKSGSLATIQESFC